MPDYAKLALEAFYSYINERSIVKPPTGSIVGPLKTPTGKIVTTDNDMANTLNTYFSSDSPTNN